MNERGHFFSEGNYDILGPPLTDGTDAITWMSTQPWSNGKVGTIGCSSTAEWQTGRRGAGESGVRGDDPARIRRGRRTRRARITSRATGIAAARCRCCSSPGCTASRIRCGRCFRRTRREEDLIRASKIVRSGAATAAGGLVEGAVASCRKRTFIKAVDGPHGIFADRMEVDTGGAMIKRTPNDPAWYRGGLWHDDHAHQRAGILVHVVVRRVGRAEPGGLQLRAQDGASRKSPTSSTR